MNWLSLLRDWNFNAPSTRKELTMATPAIIPNPTPAAPVAKTSFLQHVGGIFRKILHIGEEAAVVASPIVAVAFPSIAPLFNSAIGLAISAESTAAATTGTGPQKLAQVVTGLNPLIDQFVHANNLGDWASADRAKFASAIADALNLIPAPKAA